MEESQGYLEVSREIRGCDIAALNMTKRSVKPPNDVPEVDFHSEPTVHNCIRFTHAKHGRESDQISHEGRRRVDDQDPDLGWIIEERKCSVRGIYHFDVD